MKTVPLSELNDNVLFYDIYALEQRWADNKSWSFLETPRKKHGFMYILCNKVDIITFSGEEYSFKTGDLIYIPFGSRYKIEFDTEKGACADYQLNFLTLSRDGDDVCLYDRISFLLNFTKDDEIADIMRKAANLSTNSANPFLRLSRCFYDFISNVSDRIMLSGSSESIYGPVAPAILYIHSHLGKNPAVPFLAKRCNMSESSFRRIFKERTGFSPVHFINMAKTEQAKKMLTDMSETTVSSIAEDLGFYDLSYFYKVFYTYTGQTPAEWRKNNASDRVWDL